MSAQTLGRPEAATAASRSSRRTPGAARSAWLFLAPFGIFYLLFLVWPVAYMFITSFFTTTLADGRMIGLDHGHPFLRQVLNG